MSGIKGTGIRLIGVVTIILCLLSTSAQPATSGTVEPQASGEPDYAALADVLENEASRQVLIRQLRSMQETGDAAPNTLSASERQSGAGDHATNTDTKTEHTSLARHVATSTAHVMTDLRDQFSTLTSALDSLFSSTLTNRQLSEVINTVARFIGVVVAAFLLLLLLRVPAARIFMRLDRKAARGSDKLAMLRTITAVFIATIVDAMTVALSYIGGCLVANLLTTQSPLPGTRLLLFLNAFLIVELFKVALRMLFSTRYEHLRLMPLNATQAQYTHRFLANLADWIGYGMLVAVPIVNANVAPSLGNAVGTLVMLVALFYAVSIVMKNRKSVHDRMILAGESRHGLGRLLLRIFGQLWHILAMLYAVSVFGVTVLRPETALPYVAAATFKTLVYIGLGTLLGVVLAQLIGKEIRLSETLNTRLPNLQPRINLYIPNILKVARALILTLVVILVLDSWHFYSLAAWYATPTGTRVVVTLIHIALILLASALIWIALASFVETRLAPKESASPAAAARSQTLMGLFHTALAIVTLVFTVMIVLSEVGIDVAPLIAGAGVLGLAIGFGSQKLVQDVITGIFIQLENAMNTGDFVSAGGNSGTVERVGIRSVALRDLYGTYHIVPFSSVGAVSNFTREFGNHVGEYRIAYREDIDEAIKYLEAAFDELRAGEFGSEVLDTVTIAGVSALADNSVDIRVVIKTSPGMQWAVGRAYNRLVKIHFDRAGIEIPVPQTMLYFGQNKDGDAPPARIQMLGDASDTASHKSGPAAPSG
ncbi:mechanosensitive ion channel protein MscS [Marinobacter sp. R17]|uniref:mechanosensitive ion channel domain-containing protein n=1 Tax=Marinobacter sp. R17 TaxID=2484250 RepID=UPI000F4BEC29|nr:mechanosensitive ion channel domain-containing protein [Marinobacter sp. R17]ROU01688.1 mechanosensitive ion channel protein MscS [Marinobacter sp. R17]